jgi:ferredoxin-NADP reductase
MTVLSSDLLTLRLDAIRYAAADTCLYEFVSPGGALLPAYAPGAHVDLHMPGGIVRQYSLARPHRPGQGYMVGIKLDAATRGGSRYMLGEARVGQSFQLSAPRNNFPLHEEATHTVLIAGGIGITPIWCMAQRLEEIGSSYELHYAVRSAADAALAQATHLDVEAGGVLDVAGIVAAAPKEAHLYCCGPGPMLAAFEAATAGWPSRQAHVEYFSAPPPAPLEGGFVVELARSGRKLAIGPGDTILDAVRAAGIDAPSSCEQGVCGACETRVLEGTPDHRDHILSPSERAEGRTMMICCSGCLGERLVLDL